MNKEMILIKEEPETLVEMMKKEKDVRKLPRLQMLYLIATRQGKTRQEVGQLLGMHGETVGKWLTRYETGGIPYLLEIKAKGGSKSSLSDEVIAAMKDKLSEPQGVGTYHQLKVWVEEKFALITTYWVIYYTATVLLKARLAVARKSHIKKKLGMSRLLPKVLPKESR
jgi:transposase